jgi:DeoR/GlpR family transcriptional regulator of sugar metabolism
MNAWREMDVLFTDQPPPPEIMALLEQSKTELVMASAQAQTNEY